MAVTTRRALSMTPVLPDLTDAQKRELCTRLQRWGLLRRDERGRWWITQDGHLVGCTLTAIAVSP